MLFQDKEGTIIFNNIDLATIELFSEFSDLNDALFLKCMENYYLK